MRLRLAVRRNGVPEVKLLWKVDLDTDMTVSRLLANVSEVVPLESDDWGLEDYAVEHRDGEGDGFECLHFQMVRDILKEDDHVLIRPLLSNDMKRRRLSGRHQISIDGRHLVDGVAFGRPWLKAPDNRPSIDLPPRKRVRTSYESTDEEEEDDADWLPVEGGADVGEDPGEEYDSEYDSDERRLLTGPADYATGDVAGEEDDDDAQSGMPNHEQYTTLIPYNAVEPLLPSSPSPPLPDYPTAMETSPEPRPQTLSSILKRLKRGSPAPKAGEGAKEAVQSSMSSHSGESSGGTSSDSGSDDSDDSDSASSSDQSSSSDSDSDSSSDSSSDDEAGAAVPDSARHSAPGGSLPDDISDDTSGPSEEDTRQGRAKRVLDDSLESSDSSDSDDSSDSSSESSVEAAQPTSNKASKPNKAAAHRESAPPGPDAHKPNTATTSTTKDRHHTHTNGAEPQLTRTQKRNARRRAFKQLANERKASAALEDPGAGAAAADVAGTASQADEFLRRRQALLESLDAGESPASTTRKRKAAGEGPAVSQSGNGVDGSATSQRRKALFGLGTNKSQEEEKLPDAQPTDAALLADKGDDAMDMGAEEQEEEQEEDPDAWKEKITYGAVECVREGVELSEPPFPFVQRWDPQQQVDVWFGRSGKRGGKGKRKERNQAHYYEEERGRPEKKRKVSPWPDALEYDDDAYPNGAVDAEADVGFDEDVEDVPDDLPALPADISTLPVLARGGAATGMVITWKQWLLSKATGWQPQFGNVTAVVVRVDEDDGDSLHVLLAKRDRNLDRTEKEYDLNTGQRIYDGLEAPDLDEEEDGGDDGSRVVAFAEMMDPRVVQGPPPLEDGSGPGGGDSGANVTGEDSAPIPESFPQDGQGQMMPDLPFESFSMDLQVPPTADGRNGGSDGTSQPTTRADLVGGSSKSQKNNAALEGPSAVSSVASGRRQLDPNSIPMSAEFDMAAPDSTPGSSTNAAKARDGGGDAGKNLVRSAQKVLRGGGVSPNDAKDLLAADETGDAAVPPTSARKEEIKSTGSPESFFEVEEGRLPPHMRSSSGTPSSPVKKEKRGGSRASEERVLIDLKREDDDALPRLAFPAGSSPRLGERTTPTGRGKRRRRTSSPFELPEGSQVIDLLSEGGSSRGASPPVSGQKQSRGGTPAGSQRGRKGTPVGGGSGSQAKGRGKGKGASSSTGQRGRKKGKGGGQKGVV